MSAYMGSAEYMDDLRVDLDKAIERNARLTNALDAVLSALEDVGMDNSLAHEIASKAVKA
jgi:hypothetical protein